MKSLLLAALACFVFLACCSEVMREAAGERDNTRTWRITT